MSLTGKIKGSVLQGSINRLYELQGYSAYDVAVLNGFEGTEEEWLSSLKGEKGDPGSAVYKGDKGDDGYTPVKGVDYYTDADKEEMAEDVEESVRESLSSVTLDDYVIEHGVTDIWNWRKWASGVAEIWGTVDPKQITDEWIDLPIVVWAAPLDLPVPTVTYSVGGVALGLFSQSFDPTNFEWDAEYDDEGNVDRVTKTMWQTPRMTIYSEPEEDGNIVPLDLLYTIDVHMIGRWKPVDDEPSKEILAVNVGGGSADAVLYTEQTLTEKQQAQARENIGAVSEAVLDELKKPVIRELTYETTANFVINATDGSLSYAGNTTYCVAKVSVTPLKDYIVSGSAKFGFAYWAFYDGQDGFIKAGETAKAAISTFENVTLTAPENAKYLRVSYITDSVIAKMQTVSMELVLEQDAVLFTEQELSEEQQAQARDNIRAASADRLGDIEEAVAAEKNYESTANVVISGSNGNLLNAGNKIYCVAKVSVKPQKVYTISGSAKYGFAYWAFYDAAGALLQVSETSKLATGTIENVILTAPENAKYMHVSYSTESVIAKVQTIGVNDPKTKWKDKKWVCIGDSLTDANNTTTIKRYFDYVYYDTGIKIVNMGVSGSGYARRADDGNAFYQRVENIDTTADVVTIFGSFNDLGAGLPTGTATDTDTTTLGGCINKTIDVLQAKKPTIVLGIVSPTPWETTKPTTSGNAYNYVQLLKEICELRSIPFLDLWRGSNLRPWDADFRTLAYSKDNGAGTHPDEIGHKIIAPKFKAFLETLIM